MTRLRHPQSMEPLLAHALPRLDGADAQSAHVDQDSDQLGLVVTNTLIDPTRWTVFAAGTLPTPHGALELFVIGASHVVRWRTRSGDFCEMLACQTPDEDAGVLHASAAPLAWPSRIEANGAAAAYRGEFWRTDPGTADPSSLLPASPNSIEFTFPNSGQGPAPITRVEGRLGANPSTIEIRSLHWYEREGRAVLSKSSFSIANEQEASWIKDL